MRLRRFGLLLAFSLALTSLVFARGVDLAGTWVAVIDVDPNAQHTFTFVFEVNENTFTGTVTPDSEQSQPIREGKIEGNKITFKAGPPNDLAYLSGTIDGDTLQLDLADSDHKHQFSMTAKRKKSGQ